MKRIDEVDPNFKLNDKVPAGTVFYDPWEAPFSLWGLAPNDQRVFCRLPLELLPECSEGVRQLAYNLAGGCIRFSTDAASVSILWELTDTWNMPHFTPCGQSGLGLYEESDGGIRQVQNILPAMEDGHGCRANQTATVPLPGGMRHYVLYLPLYSGVKQLLLGFAPEARVEPGRTPRLEKPILFYGSSITQGGCAATVGSCYSTLLCRRLDAAQINLGFSGNGRGEANMAAYIASLSLSALVLDYDANAPTAEHLQKTHEPFYRIIREAQPDLPILILTFNYNGLADGYGKEADARRAVIRATYDHAVAAGDRNVYFVDGNAFYSAEDRELCTVDGAHPTTLGFLRMADVLEPVLREALDRARKVRYN